MSLPGASTDRAAEIRARTAEWYRRYAIEKGESRNDLLTNPGVLFQ